MTDWFGPTTRSMGRNALMNLPDYGFGPMTPTTQGGRQNALLQVGAQAQRPNDYLAPVAEMISPTMGSYGAGQMIGEGSRAIAEGDYMSGGAALALGMAGMIPGAPKKGIKAFHGSPHDFDKFSLDKIGTGEGAQAYGHGLYFAENEGVAKSYKDSVRKHNTAGDSYARTLLESAGGDRAAAVKRAKALARTVKPGILSRGDPEDFARLNAAVAALDDPQWNPGRMYEVSINADPEDFLDWDRPLSEQPEKVRSAVYDVLPQDAKIGAAAKARQHEIDILKSQLSLGYDVKTFNPISQSVRAEMADRIRILEESGPSPDIDQYRLLGGQSLRDIGVLDSPEVAQKLRGAGIPGIRYLDQGSRTAGDGSRNYVVFDDALIEILKKYGLAGMLGGGGAAAAALGNGQSEELY